MDASPPAAGVRLREFRVAEVDELLAAFADPEMAAWNPGPTEPVDVLEWLTRRNDRSADDHVSWAVELDGRLAGSVSLHHLDRVQGDGEVGYWTAPWARRRGVGSAALAAATTYAFDVVGLHRVQLFHAVENVGSCAVATGAGFALEGLLRQSYRFGDGKHHDEHLHARLVSD